MAYHQGPRIEFRQAPKAELRAHWLAIECAVYLLALLTLGAQFASLLSSS